MRRLFSTFAGGAPGVGLLLIRVTTGIALLAQGVEKLTTVTGAVSLLLIVLTAGIGILLLVGLFSPIAAAMASLDAAWHAFSNPGDLGFFILLGVLAVALMLLGPGAFSLDARLFGWKRIEIRNKE